MPFLRRSRNSGRHATRTSRCIAATFCAAVLSACDAAPSAPDDPTPPTGQPPASYLGPQSVTASFQLLGGYRLQVDFASEGLGLIRDADGYVVEVFCGDGAA